MQVLVDGDGLTMPQALLKTSQAYIVGGRHLADIVQRPGSACVLQRRYGSNVAAHLVLENVVWGLGDEFVLCPYCRRVHQGLLDAAQRPARGRIPSWWHRGDNAAGHHAQGVVRRADDE